MTSRRASSTAATSTPSVLATGAGGCWAAMGLSAAAGIPLGFSLMASSFFLAGRTVVRGTVGLLGVVRLDGGQGDAGLGQGVLEGHPAQQGALDTVGVLRDALEGGPVLQVVQDGVINAFAT